MIRILFGLFSTLGLLAALGTVLARNLVHAALFLVAFFFVVACQFLLLEAEFLAAVQVLVYIGAVSILMMFGIMLTRNIQGDDTTTTSTLYKLPAALVCLALIGVLCAGIGEQKGRIGRPAWSQVDARRALPPAPTAASGVTPAIPVDREAVNNMGMVIGRELMTRYVIGFELAGLLLTAALVGAIALASKDGPDELPTRTGAMASVGPGTAYDSTSGRENGHAHAAATAGPPTTTTPASPRP